MNRNLLNVQNLGSKVKNKYVYKNINIKSTSGEIIGLLGHNGAGKSTMLRNIANLEKPLEGKVSILDKQNDINKFNKDVILIPDEVILSKSLTIIEQIEISANSYGYDDKFLHKYLKTLKIDTNSKIGELSKGNQEMVQLLIMLSLNSKVFLLDEPFSAVDIFRRELIVNMLIEVSLKEDRLIIITTHLIAEVESILSRFLYLDNGEIIIDKEIEEIQQLGVTLTQYLKDYFQSEVKL